MIRLRRMPATSSASTCKNGGKVGYVGPGQFIFLVIHPLFGPAERLPEMRTRQIPPPGTSTPRAKRAAEPCAGRYFNMSKLTRSSRRRHRNRPFQPSPRPLDVRCFFFSSFSPFLLPEKDRPMFNHRNPGRRPTCSPRDNPFAGNIKTLVFGPGTSPHQQLQQPR